MARPRRALDRVRAYTELHPEEVAYLSAHELGRRCGISESSVIRAAQSLGYRGYPEYRADVRLVLAGQRTTVERFSAGTSSDSFSRAYARDRENLRRTWENLSRAAFDRAALLLATSPRVWLFGLRTPHAVAVLLREGLLFAGVDARLLTPAHRDLWDDVDRIAPGDAVVAITFPRYTRAVVEASRGAKRQGASLVALTDGPGSPLGEIADVVLAAAYSLDGFIESFTGAVSVAQALVLETARKMGGRALSTLRRKEALWAERGVYWDGSPAPGIEEDPT